MPLLYMLLLMVNNEKRLLLFIANRFAEKGTYDDLREARRYLCEVAFSSPANDPVHDQLFEIERKMARLSAATRGGHRLAGTGPKPPEPV